MTAATNAAWAATLVAGLSGEGGVTDAVVSPGSRSTPLVLALDAANLRTHVVLDERAAAFFALGLARTSGRPVALVCTSGSALGHYVPAVIEAAASCVPLLLLTADRPADSVGFGAGQTIDQVDLFGRHVRRAFHMTAPAQGQSPGWAGTVAGLALDAAVSAPAGPVHINCPYRKPLWEPGHREAAVPRHVRVLRSPARPDPGVIAAVARRLRTVERGAIVAGPAWPGLDLDAVQGLADALGWPLLAEPCSQLRHMTSVIGASDALLRDADVAAALRPSLVLRLGRLPTSTTVQNWLAGVPSVLVDAAGQWHDPGHAAQTLVVADPNLLCAALAPRVERCSAGFHDAWRNADAAAWEALHAHTDAEGQLWEGVVAAEVAAAVPPGGWLHVASSMPIRDLDGFARTVQPGVRVLHSRGANGIDGTIATAAGSAVGAAAPVTLMLGDLAFRHDVASLVLARAGGCALTLVVVDNGGGGIFAHLPIAGNDSAFERFFVTPQDDSIPQLASGFGVECVTVTGREELRRALAASRGATGVRILHVVTDRDHSVRQHRLAWGRVATAARLALGLGGAR
jgi:2-succinyl-5-enolpyruvyl-6-hydroxy-3-cyclohexene-1-carboxylate synthase